MVPKWPELDQNLKVFSAPPPPQTAPPDPQLFSTFTRSAPHIKNGPGPQNLKTATVCGWVHEVWCKVATGEFIVKGFRQNSNIDYTGEVDNLHSNLRVTLSTRELTRDVVTEVDEFKRIENDGFRRRK